MPFTGSSPELTRGPTLPKVLIGAVAPLFDCVLLWLLLFSNEVGVLLLGMLLGILLPPQAASKESINVSKSVVALILFIA
jgi:hypothetical protein